MKRFPGSRALASIWRDRSVREALFVFLLTRIFVFLILIFVGQFQTRTYRSAFAPDYPFAVQEASISVKHPGMGRRLRQIFQKGDINIYIDLANRGYERHPFDAEKRASQFYAFFPLYPLVLWSLSWLTSETILIGVLVSNVFFFFALLLLHKLVGALGYDESVADRAIFYLATFPTSYFFSTPMTESLFLLLSVGSFYAAARDRWWTAGLVGALCTASRSNGVLLIPALAVFYWQRRGLKGLRSDALGILLVPLGLIAYMIYSWHMTGNLFAFKDVQGAWGRQLAFFLKPLWRFLAEPYTIAVPWNFMMLSFAVAVLGFVSVYWLARRREWSLALYQLFSLIMPLSTGTFLSFTRFASVFFPMFIALAFSVTPGGKSDQTIRFIFIIWLGLMTALFASHVTFAVA